MGKGITETVKPSRATYEVLEEMVRVKVQEYIQYILEEEVAEFLGRKKSERLKWSMAHLDIGTATGSRRSSP